MNNSDNLKKNKKERNSNTNDTPFVSPESSPIISSINDTTVKVPIINNRLSNYKLSAEEHIESNESNQPNESNESNKPNESNESNESEDINLDTLILNLKIIAKLKPGYKLSLKENDNVTSNVYIDTSYLQYIYRIFSDNSRDNTTKFLETLDREITKKIEELVKEETFNDSNMFLNSKENILLNLSHNLNLSLVGLNNLINTYVNDEYTISKIEMIINNFELKIRKISNILKVEN
jgi:hypothetical protein